MTDAQKDQIDEFIRQRTAVFHQRRLKKLESLTLQKLLLTKNPYLYRAIGSSEPAGLIQELLDAAISSGVETSFGNFLEALAIFVSEIACGGQKSAIPGIDLEFTSDGKRYLVTVKSGPNWANKSQMERLMEYFNSARRRLRQNENVGEIVCVEGCCYGQENADYGTHIKRCGKQFWRLISDDKTLYRHLIGPLSPATTEVGAKFRQVYASQLNAFTKEFIREFCVDGAVQWDRIVQVNSRA